MPLTNEELQLVEQAINNEIYNIGKVIDRSPDHNKQDWVIKLRRLKVALRELKDNVK